MAQTMKQSGAAVQYARALLDLANEKKQAEPIGQEMAELGKVIESNKTLGSFLSDQGISQALNKDAIVHQYVDETIIGGIVVRVDDKLIDVSDKNQLESMKRQLLAATPR